MSLVEAATAGNGAEVRRLIGAGANLEERGIINGGTALHWTARIGPSKIVRVLLEAGANVNAVDGLGYTPLHWAGCRNNNLETVRILLEGGADPSIRNKEGKLPIDITTSEEIKALLRSPPPEPSVMSLVEAATAGNGAEVRRLIDAGANLEEKGGVEEGTALLYAGLEGHSECVGVLLEAGANVNAVGLNGWTPLHVAAGQGHSECVGVLLEAGANVNAVGLNGWTPLHVAAGQRHSECARVLLEAGANVNAVGMRGISPLHLAPRYGDSEIVGILVEAGANVNAVLGELDDGTKSHLSGGTPLHVAASENILEIVRILLEGGADRSIRNKYGKLPIDVTISEEIKALLRDRDFLIPASNLTPFIQTIQHALAATEEMLRNLEADLLSIGEITVVPKTLVASIDFKLRESRASDRVRLLLSLCERIDKGGRDEEVKRSVLEALQEVGSCWNDVEKHMKSIERQYNTCVSEMEGEKGLVERWQSIFLLLSAVADMCRSIRGCDTAPDRPDTDTPFISVRRSQVIHVLDILMASRIPERMTHHHLEKLGSAIREDRRE